MVGFLQIIIILGCIYLVMKALAIIQTGLASSRPSRTELLIFGGVCLAFAIVSAVFILKLMADQALVMSDIGAPPF